MILKPTNPKPSPLLDRIDDFICRWGMWINLAWISALILLMLSLTACKDHSKMQAYRAEEKAKCEAKGGIYSQNRDAQWVCGIPKAK